MKLNGENGSQLRTTMKVLDNVSENKCQVNNQKEELISSANSTASNEFNQTEKENYNMIPRNDNKFFGDSEMIEGPQESSERQYPGQQISTGEYLTNQLSAKYQSSIILQNPRTFSDTQLQSALDREASLRQMLSSREAGMREIDQKVENIENKEVKDNSIFKLPKNISANKLRDMIEDYEQKQRILNRKNQFLITEIRELASIKYMFTDHSNKMSKYIQRLNMEGFKWRREYVKLLQACLGATQTDPHHRLMFSDYGKDRYKNLISELLDEARRKDPSLPTMIK
ncbi:uncharacterized protein DC041_0008720 [Schistosoma bovis]|uniref:Uncharacterized protein n=1 Tax=Schistosoma bovis TaxID=6184 RepID=A0A430QJG5_SCHBO|nr:uncharacterized protein DC041_0008720 [Schistosoma bovis]